MAILAIWVNRTLLFVQISSLEALVLASYVTYVRLTPLYLSDIVIKFRQNQLQISAFDVSG